MADHDQQYLIEMDANQTAKTLFNVGTCISLQTQIQTYSFCPDSLMLVSHFRLKNLVSEFIFFWVVL